MTTSPYVITAAEQAVIDRVAELAVGFAEDAAGYDDRAELPIANLLALHSAGADAAVLPASLGGGGISNVAFGEIVRTIAAADPSTATIWLMHVGAGVG